MSKIFRIPMLLLTTFYFCCKCENNIEVKILDNDELILIYNQDQQDRMDRMTDRIDSDMLRENDWTRRKRVIELLDSNKVVTSNDYANAAMIFQHGGGRDSYEKAVELMTRAIEIDPNRNKWLLAAATDRMLLSQNKPQIYGTQISQRLPEEPYKLTNFDSTKITNKEREEFGISLDLQRKRVDRLNKNKLELLYTNKGLSLVVDEISNKNPKDSEYDIYEEGINEFGYYLINKNKHVEALKIFQINTKIYPKAFNTYDSYGECLLKLNRISEALRAYKISIELNPENENARKVIEKYDIK